ncbi:MAG: zf-HC2 domain-containing protein [Ktedonobacterales bacterium]|nr:zf-HC2 domain-containing protein [Ktedonobacterales bacterium]
MQPLASCADVADLLPLLADGVVTTATEAALAHVRTCPSCQSTIAQYHGIDGAVRRYYTRFAPPPHSSEEIMDFIIKNAPVIPPQSKTTTILPRRWPAVSGAFLLCLVAVLIGTFALTRSQPHPVATPTPSPNNTLNAVSMIAPTEGWAVANPYDGTWDLNLPDTWKSSTLYHYSNGQWLPYSLSAPAFIAVHLYQLHMLSPTDGWALGDAIVKPDQTRQVILHYNGETWSPIADDGQATPDHTKEFLNYGGFGVISDASLWVAASVMSTTQQQTKLPAIGHLTNGHTWTLEDLPLPTRGVNINISVLSLAMVNDDEGWVAARINDPSASPGKEQAVLYHRLHGTWRIDTTIPQGVEYFSQIVMTSASEGWATGQANSSAGISPDLTLYRYHGGKWTMQQPIGYGDGVLCGLSSQDGTLLLNNHPLLNVYAYDGSQWRFTQSISSHATDPITLYDCSFATPHDGWAVGFGTHIKGHTTTYYPIFLHDAQGKWSVDAP